MPPGEPIDWQQRYRARARAERRATLTHRRTWLISIAIAAGALGAMIGPTWPLRLILAAGLVTLAAVFAGVFGAAHANARARTAILTEWSALHGFVPGAAPVWPPFAPLNAGERQEVIHSFCGTLAGRTCAWVNFTYETSVTDADGRRQVQQHPFALLLMDLPLPVQSLRLTSRTLGGFGRVISDRISSGLSSRQAVAVENAEFARRYALMIDDQDAEHLAFLLFPPNLQEQFTTGMAFAEQIHTLESDGKWLMIAWQGHIGPPELDDLLIRLEQAGALSARWQALPRG